MSDVRWIGTAALLGLLCACGETSGQNPDLKLRELESPSGELVAVPSRPLRVFSDSATGFDLMLALLPRERFAGVVSTAVRYSALARTGEELTDLARPDGFHAETILALEPDLVLVSDWRPPTVPSILAERGIPTATLPTPQTFEDLLDLVHWAALLFDRVEQGEQLAEELERRRATLAEESAGESLRVVSYSNYGTAGYCAGSGTSWDLMIRLAGLENAAASAGIEGNQPLDLEQLIQLDPDLLLVSESEEGGNSPTLDNLKAHPAASTLRAVKEGRWVVLPVHLHATSSHHLLDAAEALAEGARRWQQ